MKTRKLLTVALAALVAVMASSAGHAFAGKPSIAGGCKNCHQAAPETVRGKMGTVSENFQTMQVAVGKAIWIIKFDQETNVKEGIKLSGADNIKSIPKNKEVLISYSGNESSPLATMVAVKQPYKVPNEQLLSTEELHELIAPDSSKGSYTLIDSRPLASYLAGHISTAKSLPYGAFQKKYAQVLPEDKKQLLVFYCGGFT